MKRLTLLCCMLALMAGLTPAHAQKAKYVFFFIGDGMGLNQVNTTEMYLAMKQDGRIGTHQLLFGSFPVAGMATTFSASNSITDSAAGGTALATGTKTYNGAIGVDTQKQPLQSRAYRAQQSGRRVGIATSVSVDHATPASFYAHQPNRNNYYEIAAEIADSDFDFFAGSGFLKPNTMANGQTATPVFDLIEQDGYVIARGMDEFEDKADEASKMVLLQADGAADCLPSAIDRDDDDLTLAQITTVAIDFLTRGKNPGFFLMVEGGKIDWACHDNDARTALAEIIDMDQAIQVAYDFYKRHPKETLIVVSADHETGGLGMGNSDYTLHLKMLDHQKQSLGALSRRITDLRKQGHTSWEQVKQLLTETMGFWKDVDLTWEQERMLRDEYEASFVQQKVKFEETLYSTTEPLAAAARKVLNQVAGLGWTTGSHSAEYVPVYAIGAGADLFMGKMDNTDIPKRIAKAARYK